MKALLTQSEEEKLFKVFEKSGETCSICKLQEFPS
jgi:hypothetical protein